MLKSYGVGGWWVVGGLEQFSVSPRPLAFGFGAKGSGPGLDNFLKSSTSININCRIQEDIRFYLGIFLE